MTPAELLHRALARRLTVINLLLLHQLQRRHDTWPVTSAGSWEWALQQMCKGRTVQLVDAAGKIVLTCNLDAASWISDAERRCEHGGKWTLAVADTH